MKIPKNIPQNRFLPYYEALGEEGLEMLWLYLNGYTVQAEYLFKSLCAINGKSYSSHEHRQGLYNQMSSL